jgi:hypothetical protein
MVTAMEWLIPCPKTVTFPVAPLRMEAPVLNALAPERHVPALTPRLCAFGGLLGGELTLTSMPWVMRPLSTATAAALLRIPLGAAGCAEGAVTGSHGADGVGGVGELAAVVFPPQAARLAARARVATIGSRFTKGSLRQNLNGCRPLGEVARPDCCPALGLVCTMAYNALA